MSQLPLPPGFEEILAARRARRRRRRIFTAVLAVALLLVAGMTVTFLLARGNGTPTGADRPARSAERSCTTPTTDLEVASSPDLAPVLTSLAAEFSDGGADADGRCVWVRVTSIEDGPVAEALAGGWNLADLPRPDAWAPSSSAYVALLQSLLTSGQRPALVDPDAEPVRLATSPIVWAMPRPMAQALGWPDAAISWSQLRDVALDPDGWGRYGHPEWGPLRLGTSIPLVIPTDLRSRPATVEDWSKADAAGQGLTFLSALVTEESQVAGYNQGNPTNDPDVTGAAPSTPLVAVYPADGTQVADHPFVTLTGDWMTAPKRSAAAAFADYLTSPPALAVFEAAHFRDPYGVLADPRASDLGLNPVPPAATLPWPGPQQIEPLLSRWSTLGLPLSVLTVLDVSGSMAGQIEDGRTTKILAATQVLTAALGQFDDRDELGLWSFSGGQDLPDYRVRVTVGPLGETADGAPRREAMTRALDALRARGRTSLYNTLADAVARLGQRPGTDRRRAVVLITDGRNDLVGGLTLDELLARIKAAPPAQRVPVMTIAFGSDADRRRLATIAQTSGGAAFVASTQSELAQAYAAALAAV